MGLETNTRQPDPNCIFCKIVKGEIPSKFLLETDSIVAFNDISPQAPTHVLVIPKQHVKDISQFNSSAEDRALLGTLFQQAAELAQKLFIGQHKSLTEPAANTRQDAPRPLGFILLPRQSCGPDGHWE